MTASAKCLDALNEMSEPGGEMCVPFAPIMAATELDRRTVRLNIRALARKGYVEYFRGLCIEDGDFAGAGYCITKTGMALCNG